MKEDLVAVEHLRIHARGRSAPHRRPSPTEHREHIGEHQDRSRTAVAGVRRHDLIPLSQNIDRAGSIGHDLVHQPVLKRADQPSSLPSSSGRGRFARSPPAPQTPAAEPRTGCELHYDRRADDGVDRRPWRPQSLPESAGEAAGFRRA